jgi:hypothetical protein
MGYPDSGGDTAKLLGTVARHVQQRISHLGIRPAITLETRGAVFYDRQDIFRRAVALDDQHSDLNREARHA